MKQTALKCYRCGGTLVAHEEDNVDWGIDWEEVDPLYLTLTCNTCQEQGQGILIAREVE